MKLSKLNQLIEDGKEVKGRWEITPDHQIQYKKASLDEEIKVRGALVAAESRALVIAVTEKQVDQVVVTSIYKLTGSWKTNATNQLVFEIEKELGKKDVLTFKKRWKVNSHHEIVYTYEQTNLKTKKKESQELGFQGVWDIADKNSLIYFVGGDSDSVFRFRGTFQTKSIRARQGEIRYQIGANVTGKRKRQTIVLFGKWKISKELGLNFEVEYANKRTRVVSFGGEYDLKSGTSILVNLKNVKAQPLGVEVILTKDIFGKDGKLFVRLQKSLEDSRLEAGMNFKW